MLPSTDLSHSSQPHPFTHRHVINERTVLTATKGAVNTEQDGRLLLKEVLKIQCPLIYEPCLLVLRVSVSPELEIKKRGGGATVKKGEIRYYPAAFWMKTNKSLGAT